MDSKAHMELDLLEETTGAVYHTGVHPTNR